MVTKIVFLITAIAFGINIIREILVYRDIKSFFYCGHCNTFNDEISRGGKCSKCNRSLKIKGKQWQHLLLHRVNWIPAKGDREVFKWKEYKKLSVIEITLSILASIILIIGAMTI